MIRSPFPCKADIPATASLNGKVPVDQQLTTPSLPCYFSLTPVLRLGRNKAQAYSTMAPDVLAAYLGEGDESADEALRAILRGWILESWAYSSLTRPRTGGY